MKQTLSILFLGTALTFAACGKDKKPSTSEPTAADPAKPEEKKAGGW